MRLVMVMPVRLYHPRPLAMAVLWRRGVPVRRPVRAPPKREPAMMPAGITRMRTWYCRRLFRTPRWRPMLMPTRNMSR